MGENQSLAKLVEEISEAIVFADLGNLQTIVDILGKTEQLKSSAQEAAAPAVATLAGAIASELESIIMKSSANEKKCFADINDAIGALQQIVTDNKALDEVELPERFGNLSQPDSAPADEEASGFVLPAAVDEKIFYDFLARQGGVLEELEASIMGLEKEPDGEDFALIKRILHTIKGEAGLLGLDDVGTLCHKTEDCLSEGNPAQMIDALLAVKDWLDRAFSYYGAQGDAPESFKTVLEQFEAAGDAAPTAEQPATAATEATPAADLAPIAIEGDPSLISEFVTESMEHLDSADVSLLTLETEPTDEDALNAVFRAFHTIKGVSGFLALEDIRSLAHEAENLLDKSRRGELPFVGGVIDVTFDSVDMLKRLIGYVGEALQGNGMLQREEDLPALKVRIQQALKGELVDAPSEAPPEIVVDSSDDIPEPPKLGELLVKSGSTTEDIVTDALRIQRESGGSKKLGEVLVRDEHIPARDVAKALRTQKTPQQVKIRETVKVDADRLDMLIDMIGELVISETMVSQSKEVKEIDSPILARHIGQLSKITRELQEMGMSLRMVPLRATFQKMARMVRDLSKKTNKQVDFVMAGEDTELDKTVVDKIGDPLVHMVRNAVDHGLEMTPDDRTKNGKGAVGRVELRAFHKGGSIFIEIEDDGRGIDKDRILAKGIERGLVREGETLSDREIYNLIFAPGFSTAQQITDVSGRGVGMDVVRKNIDMLRGQVEIQSELGKGSVFSIRLPLTLAIIDGMVIRIGEERYIIPTLSIVRSVRPQASELSSVLGSGEMFNLQGELLPVYRLSHLFNVDNQSTDLTNAIIVVVEDDGKRVGVVVEELLGQQQIVIKSLGSSFEGLQGISGGAIMPDGSVGLIVDIAGLVRLAHQDGKIEETTAV